MNKYNSITIAHLENNERRFQHRSFGIGEDKVASTLMDDLYGL